MGLLITILGILLMAVLVAASIALHECGHLFFAKLFKVRVPQYMIGFGPKLFSFRRGETEYGFRLFPLGGYITMIGMYPPNTEEQRNAVAAQEQGKIQEQGKARGLGALQQLAYQAREQAHAEVNPGDENRVFYRLPVYQRLLIMFGGPVMNLLIAAVILTVLVSTIGIAKPTTTVSTVSLCVKEEADLASKDELRCTEQDPRSPAAAAGLKPGDEILSYNGQAVASWDELTQRITSSADQRSSISYRRDGKVHETTITPMASERVVKNIFGAPQRNFDGSLATAKVGFIGIGSTVKQTPAGPGEAMKLLGQQIGAVASLVVVLPQTLFHTVSQALAGKERDPNGPISIVGVGYIAGEISSQEGISLGDRFTTLLSLAAGLNVALFVFNMVPLLPLDGGHIAGALYEGVRRRWAALRHKPDPGPFDASRWLPLTYVVFAALLVMGVSLMLLDVINPVRLFGP